MKVSKVWGFIYGGTGSSSCCINSSTITQADIKKNKKLWKQTIYTCQYDEEVSKTRWNNHVLRGYWPKTPTRRNNLDVGPLWWQSQPRYVLDDTNSCARVKALKSLTMHDIIHSKVHDGRYAGRKHFNTQKTANYN